MRYDEAAQRYRGCRDKRTGAYLAAWRYVGYDAAKDCYLLQEPLRVYDESGQRIPKDEWEMRPVVEIYRDRVMFLNAGWPISLSTMYGVTRSTSTSYGQYHTRGTWWWHFGRKQQFGGYPVTLKDGKLSGPPPLKRVVDADRKKEFNAVIRRARNILRARIRLGALPSQVEAETYFAWGEAVQAEAFYAKLCALREDDLETATTILAQLKTYRMYLGSRKASTLAVFENTVRAIREPLLRRLGIVRYE